MADKRWYGLIGLLSLLGFVGVFTGEKYFLGFFAFAVDFQYFFAKADEMQEGQILRSAARGFFAGMGVPTTEALYLSSGLGWGVGAAVYALSSFLCGCREWWNARA